MRRITSLIMLVVLIVLCGGCKNGEKTNIEPTNMLTINPKLNNIVITKKSGTPLIEEEKNDIKLILSIVMYADDNFQKAEILKNGRNEEEEKKLKKTIGNIINSAIKRGNDKTTDEKATKALMNAAASADTLILYVYADMFSISDYDPMEYYESYKKAKEKCMNYLIECYNFDFNNNDEIYDKYFSRVIDIY